MIGYIFDWTQNWCNLDRFIFFGWCFVVSTQGFIQSWVDRGSAVEQLENTPDSRVSSIDSVWEWNWVGEGTVCAALLLFMSLGWSGVVDLREGTMIILYVSGSFWVDMLSYSAAAFCIVTMFLFNRIGTVYLGRDKLPASGSMSRIQCRKKQSIINWHQTKPTSQNPWQKQRKIYRNPLTSQYIKK